MSTIKMIGVWLVLALWGITAPAGTVTYVYTGAQGTPLAEADASGNITARFEYTPYGMSVPSMGLAPNGPGYTGHVNDPDTGLVYMQARYYDPAVGRFLSVDPVAPNPGNTFNFNRFDYANNNPINHTDPDGRSVWTKAIKLVINGGNIAQTVAGVVGDAKTVISPNASAGERVVAAVSLASEALPVSIGDAKDIAKAFKSIRATKTEIHHIVPKADRRAAEARSHMLENGMDPKTEKDNLVPLSGDRHDITKRDSYVRDTNDRILEQPNSARIREECCKIGENMQKAPIEDLQRQYPRKQWHG